MDYNRYKDRLLRNSNHNGEFNKTDCVNWAKSVKGIGYGYMTIGSRTDNSRKNMRAHRLSYEIFVGAIGDKCVLHRCDNPRCINPHHLFLGTHADNNTDRDSKGRQLYYSGEENAHSKLTNVQAEEIRLKYKLGGYTHRKLADEYGFKDHTPITAILNHKSYPSPPKE